MCWRGRTKSLSNGSILLASKDMKKKIAVLTLSAMVFALCSFADAQQTGKIFRIGFLYNGPASGGAVLIDAFRQELSRLGLIDGKNLTIEYRFAEQKSSGFLSLRRTCF